MSTRLLESGSARLLEAAGTNYRLLEDLFTPWPSRAILYQEPGALVHRDPPPMTTLGGL